MYEKCGIFGVYGLENAAEIAYLGLFLLQHRGQEGAGIVVSDGRRFKEHRGIGLVTEVFDTESLQKLTGHIALGHVRYSTTGAPSSRNIQPLLGECRFGTLAIAHNGNLTNTLTLWQKLGRGGAIFQSTTDTELILHLVARSAFDSLEDALKEALWQIRGAFSIGVISAKALFAARDPWGFRPLCLGRLHDGYLISSESCVFDILGAEFLREIEPGEMLVIDEHGPRSFFYAYSSRKAFCAFEIIYFARPDSVVFGNPVYEARKKMGALLAQNEDCLADMVTPVPDSGIFAALGFAEASGIPFEFAFIRSPYVGRTFIQPSQDLRDLGVRLKLNPLRNLIKGKRVIVIEDSIVRGSTSSQRIATLKAAGAREVHMRVSSPPHRFPCFYGIDFPTREELLAARMSLEDMKTFLGLDSLRYLSLEGLKQSLVPPEGRYCFACFTGEYPVHPEEGIGKLLLEEHVASWR